MQVTCIVTYVVIVSSVQATCIVGILSSMQVVCIVDNLSSTQVVCIVGVSSSVQSDYIVTYVIKSDSINVRNMLTI